jgi:hypothetical protein
VDRIKLAEDEIQGLVLKVDRTSCSIESGNFLTSCAAVTWIGAASRENEKTRLRPVNVANLASGPTENTFVTTPLPSA